MARRGPTGAPHPETRPLILIAARSVLLPLFGGEGLGGGRAPSVIPRPRSEPGTTGSGQRTFFESLYNLYKTRAALASFARDGKRFSPERGLRRVKRSIRGAIVAEKAWSEAEGGSAQRRIRGGSRTSRASARAPRLRRAPSSWFAPLTVRLPLTREKRFALLAIASDDIGADAPSRAPPRQPIRRATRNRSPL